MVFCVDERISFFQTVTVIYGDHVGDGGGVLGTMLFAHLFLINSLIFATFWNPSDCGSTQDAFQDFCTPSG